MSSHQPPCADAPARGEARARILEVATPLFLSRGYADVSMQEIADAAGVTKAALYYHFRGKDALFAEVAQASINQFWEGIIARAEAGASLREALKNIAAYVRESAGTISSTLIEDIRRHLPPQVQMEILTGHPAPEAALENLFRRAIAAGEMRPLDVEPVAALFVGMVMGFGQRGHSQRPVGQTDEELLVDVLLRGIGADPDAQ